MNFAVAFIDVARQQTRRVGVGASDQHDVGTSTRPRQGARPLSVLMNCLRRHEHLAAQVAALLLGGELVLEVHARGAGFDHRLHQLEGVERAAEAGLGVGDDRREPVTWPFSPSAVWIWSARCSALLMRAPRSGTLFAG